MRSVLLAVAVLFVFGCSDPPPAGGPASGPRQPNAADRGDELIADFRKRDAAPFRKTRVRLTTTEGDKQEVFEVDVWRKQSGNETRTLSQIIKPVEDTDLASLAVEVEGQPTKTTTYVASREEFRETDTNKMFFGGLTAGELLGEWDKFDFEFVGEKELDGRRGFEVKGTLKPGRSGVVYMMTIMMRADDLVPVELKLYDSTERHIRTYRVVEVKTDQRGPYPARTEVENLVYKNRTVIEVLNREFPDNLDDSFFTRDKLKEIAAGGK